MKITMVGWQYSTTFLPGAALLFMLGTNPVTAQEVKGGRLAYSSVGVAGQRQTRDQVAPSIKPTGRIGGRIASRVQSRIRTRVDSNYNPQTNAQSPFEVAEDQLRAAGRPIPH